MRKLALVALVVVVLAVAAIVLLRRPPKPTPGTITANGFALKSASITLPTDDALFPAGPHADAINANCTACHATSMVLTQPRLTPEQWAAEVKKMREAYKAPIAESDVPAILAYLNAMPGQRAAPAK